MCGVFYAEGIPSFKTNYLKPSNVLYDIIIINMKKNDLKRDELDYILTDVLPVELSELYTNTYFYNYLHKNRKQIEEIAILIKEQVFTFKQTVPFCSNSSGNHSWASIPLSYNILKPDRKSKRKMSVLQPLAILNIYFFIRFYQKDMLNALKKSKYSIRYHSRNNDLVYKSRSNSPPLIDYQYKRNRKSKKFLEQSGLFFDIGPVGQISNLTSGERWRLCNLRYKYFCKLDYKRCFDSIYTHSYKWIVSKNTVDSKSFKNSSLYACIDRILQNINGYSSNGIIVGPEFSRLIVEILLQEIDSEVYRSLAGKGIILNEDYVIMRYVDDIFLFTNNENVQDKIIDIIEEKSRKYLLELNQQKIEKQTTPYFRGDWLNEMKNFVVACDKTLRSNRDIERSEQNFQIELKSKNIQDIKSTFINILGKNKDNIVSITNYAMSVFLNRMSSKSRKYNFFKNGATDRTVGIFLDLVFYIYSHCVNFRNTQKLISIIYYCHNEVGLKKSNYLQKVINKFEFAFNNIPYSEVINLLIALDELGVHLSIKNETRLFANILKADNPIALATYLYYSRYNSKYHIDISSKVNEIINKRIKDIQKLKEGLNYREFWYVLVFNKCPYINCNNQKKIDEILRKIANGGSGSADKSVRLLVDFMLDKNEKYSFITWNTNGARMMQEITYRTNNKTVFKERSSDFLASL